MISSILYFVYFLYLIQIIILLLTSFHFFSSCTYVSIDDQSKINKYLWRWRGEPVLEMTDMVWFCCSDSSCILGLGFTSWGPGQFIDSPLLWMVQRKPFIKGKEWIPQDKWLPCDPWGKAPSFPRINNLEWNLLIAHSKFWKYFYPFSALISQITIKQVFPLIMIFLLIILLPSGCQFNISKSWWKRCRGPVLEVTGLMLLFRRFLYSGSGFQKLGMGTGLFIGCLVCLPTMTGGAHGHESEDIKRWLQDK